MTAPRPGNDFARVAALRELQAVEVIREGEFDDLTALAAHICEAPSALLTVIEQEEQHYRGQFGDFQNGSTPRDIAFCSHAIFQPSLFVIPDAQADPRFAGNPMVTGEPHIRFYAGAPLTTSGGFQLGTLCIIDRVPRELTPHQEQSLQLLSRHVVAHLELRRSEARRRQAEEALLQSNLELERRVRARTEELAEAHERLELAIRAAEVRTWEWSFVTDAVTDSERWKEELGYGRDEFPGTGEEWRKRTHPDDLPRINEEIALCLQDPARVYRCETRYRRKDGSWSWALTRARLQFDEVGRPLRMLGCHIDVTERRNMEERLRDLTAHLHHVREEEAGRMARELHDELGASLTGLKFDVAWLERQLHRLLAPAESAPLRERLQSLDGTLSETIASVRKVCRDLRPALLDELGLAAALEWQVAEFGLRSGVPCHLDRPESLTATPACATALFRILQELLTNISRHAEAREVRVKLRTAGPALEMTVTDDGKGLPPGALTRGDRFGLMGVRERSASAGGTAEFQSPVGGGTCVTVRLPSH